MSELEDDYETESDNESLVELQRRNNKGKLQYNTIPNYSNLI